MQNDTHPTPPPEPAPYPADGHVEPGGPSAVRRLPGLVLRKASVGPMDNNTYLLRCPATGERLLVDAAAEPERLQALLAEDAAEAVAEGEPTPRLTGILTTHAHHDHVGALAELAAATGAPVLAGQDDAADLPVPVQRPLRDGETISLGATRLEVIGLRGHTPGSVAVLWRGGEAGDHLLTGDSLFPGGVGNTGVDPERFAQLLGDVTARIFDRLGDGTRVYPGHGDDTTLGAERPSLPAWRERGW